MRANQELVDALVFAKIGKRAKYSELSNWRSLLKWAHWQTMSKPAIGGRFCFVEIDVWLHTGKVRVSGLEGLVGGRESGGRRPPQPDMAIHCLLLCVYSDSV